MTVDSRPLRADLMCQQLPGETLVYMPGGAMCVINETAREIWDLCDGRRTNKQVAGAFADMHPDEDREDLVGDAIEVLSLLKDAGLVL